MLGVYDIALMAGLFALCRLGLRGGVAVTALLAAGLAGCIVLALSVGTAEGLLGLVALWFLLAFGIVSLWRQLRRERSTAGSRAAALIIAAMQFAVLAVLGTGALVARAGPDSATVRSAAAYPMIAEVGGRLTDQDHPNSWRTAIPLSFPAPLVPDAPAAPDPTARPIDWAKVTTFGDGVTRILTGHTIAADRAPISFEIGGTVTHVHLALGETFRAGEILAELDPEPLQITRDERRAALREAKALAREAGLTLDRQRQLLQSGTISQAALDRAEAAAESAEGRVAIARAGVHQAEDRLAGTVLRAPFDGVVDRRLIDPAQTVQAGQPAFEIQNANAGHRIEMIVPETLIGRIDPGTEHRAILLDGRDSPLVARIHEIGTRAFATTGFPVTLDILAHTVPIRAGMTVEVHLSLPKPGNGEDPADLAAVPYTAILPGDGGSHVSFVYDPATRTLEQRTITVAAREGKTALVADGLAPGEIVATRGLPFLIDGQPVALRGVGIARYDD